MIQIVSYSNDSRLKIISSSGNYCYAGISPYTLGKIENLLRRRLYGKVWQILRKHRLERD
jgi:hypothetical protein